MRDERLKSKFCGCDHHDATKVAMLSSAAVACVHVNMMVRDLDLCDYQCAVALVNTAMLPSVSVGRTRDELRELLLDAVDAALDEYDRQTSRMPEATHGGSDVVN